MDPADPIVTLGNAWPVADTAAMGDFVRAIGEGISGLVGGSIHALSVAFDTVVGSMQQMLPGPLFPLFVIGFVVILALLFRRLF